MRAVLVTMATAVALSGCWLWTGKVVLPHRTLAYEDACPGYQNVRCHPDDDRRALIFNLTPPALEIHDGEPAYNRFVGRAFRQPYQRGDIGRYCNDATSSPFVNAEHFDLASASSSFTYSYTLSSTLKANAEADLVEAATAAGLPPGAAEQVEAAARAAFERAKDREVSTTGRMQIVRLNLDTIEELRFGTEPELAACRQFLAENPAYALVKAATVFHIRRSGSDTEITSDITSEIQASVQGLSGSELANVNAAIERSVRENVQTALSDRYLVWAVTWLRPEDV